MATPLGHTFRVRLWNFKATGVQNHPRAQTPYCMRGNVDGNVFNTEYFYGASMNPMWSFDHAFDYSLSDINQLRSKYVVLECYGGEAFLGMARIDLYSVATGPTSFELALKEGQRHCGVLQFKMSFEHVTNVMLSVARMNLDNIGARGYEANPNAYLSYGFAENTVQPVLESPVAASTVSPSWDRLTPLHLKCSMLQLANTRVRFNVLHSRNGYSAGLNDPCLAVFDVPLGPLLADMVGRDQGIARVNAVVHSVPEYPHAFSTPMTGVVEFQNLPRVVQLSGGIMTDEGVINAETLQHTLLSASAAAPTATASHGSFHNSSVIQPGMGGSPSRQRSPPGAASRSRHVSPMKSQPATDSINASLAGTTFHAPSSMRQSGYVSPVKQRPIDAHSSSVHFTNTNTSFVGTAKDIEVFDEVTSHQTSLLSRVTERHQDIVRRKNEVQRQIAEHRQREEQEAEMSVQRRNNIEAELRNALSERDAVERKLAQLQVTREEELRLAAVQAAERDRARAALEEEQRQVSTLEAHVQHLRNEMARHSDEEEMRYQQRVAQAEAAKRRALTDEDELRALEQRLADAELRSSRRRVAEEATQSSLLGRHEHRLHHDRTGGSPSRLRANSPQSRGVSPSRRGRGY